MNTVFSPTAPAAGPFAPGPAHLPPSDDALHFIAGYFAALADPMRLKILRALMSGEQNVSTLVVLTGARQPVVSRHLGRLAAVGLVHRRRQGTNVNYSLTDVSTRDLCAHVCGLLERRLTRQAAVVAGR